MYVCLFVTDKLSSLIVYSHKIYEKSGGDANTAHWL